VFKAHLSGPHVVGYRLRPRRRDHQESRCRLRQEAAHEGTENAERAARGDALAGGAQGPAAAKAIHPALAQGDFSTPRHADQLSRAPRHRIARRITLNTEVIHTGQLRPSTVNKPYASDKPIRTFWAAACSAAGVKYRFPRQLRHTYASWMLKAGEDPSWVSRRMGHKNLAVTLEKYARDIPSMNQGAGMKAAQAFRDSQAGKRS
jgi:hypothetical protein